MAAARRLPPLLLLLATLTVSRSAGLNCLQEGNAGEVSPRVVNTLPNQTFQIACYMDPSHPDTLGLTSADLYFTRDFTAGTGEAKKADNEPVPASQSKMVDSTTLVMEDRLETAVHYKYSCRVRGRENHRGKDPSLCSSAVNVGYPPLDVKNFSCLVNNWNSITCNWTVQYNAIKSQYQLQYLLKPSFGSEDSPPREQWVLCPMYNDELPEFRTSCSIDAKTQPVYRPGAEHYNFTMNITNALGTRLQWLGLVDNFARVLPAAPKKVEGVQKTADSVLLETTVGYPMDIFPRPLDFDVTYTSAWDRLPQAVNSSSMGVVPGGADRSRPRPLLVAGLRPYTEYHFSVRMRSSVAEPADLWSPATELRVRTLSLAPAAPPQLDRGSFQLLRTAAGSRTVLVYWRQIPPWQQNGANFSYCMSAQDESGRRLRPSLTTNAYARFTHITERPVAFQVASCNAVGRSAQSSTMTVPDQRQVGKPPHSVTLRISGPGQYQLLWQHAAADRAPSSFTLFNCEHRPDRPYQCQGQIQMWHVSGQTRQHSLSLPVGQEYQFAVSANYEADSLTGAPATSSGMVWSRCSAPFSKDGTQVIQGLSFESTHDRSVTLTWSDDCASQVSVSRVMVIYCELIDHKCRGEETSREMVPKSPSSLTLTGLRPYTRYRISVAVITGDRQGPRSAPQVVETLQARPEPPAHTQVTDVGNTSLIVRWRPPNSPNGPLQHYLVLVTGRQPMEVPASDSSVVVTSLEPYTAYNVTVRACTASWRSVGCSRQSQLAAVRTGLGAPGVMEPPRTRLLNTSAVMLRWLPPPRLGGPRLFYVIRSVSEVDGFNYTQANVSVPGDQLEMTEQLVHACRAAAHSQRHLFWVRAVTKLPSGGELRGPWSEPTEQNCVLTAEWPLAGVLGLVAGALLLMALAVLVFCLCSRTKREWVKMRDIGVNLPSGLERPEKGLPGFGGPERRSGPAAAGYGRLVSQPGDHQAAPAGRPLLQEEPTPAAPTGISETPPSTATDSNSYSSSATNYTDSGAESEKVGSPTYERSPWPPGTAHLAPYVQAGGPATSPTAGPVYTKFSPYVDAKAIQSLLTRGGAAAADDPPADDPSAQLTCSEPDLSAAVGRRSPLPYSQIGLRSSAGYVSMASEDALPPSPPPPPPPAEKEPERPYVALGPSPPAVSAAGFPPYVLAGLAAEEGGPYSGEPPPERASPPTGAYVTSDRLQPAGIELRDLASAASQAVRTSDAVEPVLSPKKLATVASTREPYCRVVTQHQAAAELGPNVSMV